MIRYKHILLILLIIIYEWDKREIYRNTSKSRKDRK
ncbi:MAG: hypothetical protein ACD_49C00026G0017 [uncultured bacterium (gcode 4)]|uniref:Uncharacterized protein n=1 Tax=uncultured bacterium (gcode 4) TaxID=1234023 RepID=K2AY71_9BACT|nr:MAG: hypothetical protein ACD_49C00026G0017 [uncultured bacterium (gcode 4)]